MWGKGRVIEEGKNGGGLGGWEVGKGNWQVRQNNLEGVSHLVNACNRSLEGNCQAASLRYFYISISGRQCGLDGFL